MGNTHRHIPCGNLFEYWPRLEELNLYIDYTPEEETNGVEAQGR